MSELGVVYTLEDPRTNKPKYVGSTIDPHSRLEGHVSGNTNPDVKRWIQSLEEDGEEPIMNIVRVAPKEKLTDYEKTVLSQLMDEFELYNRDMNPVYTGKSTNKPETRYEEDTGWLKCKLPKEYHDRLRTAVKNSDMRTHELASHWIMEYMDMEDVGIEDD